MSPTKAALVLLSFAWLFLPACDEERRGHGTGGDAGSGRDGGGDVDLSSISPFDLSGSNDCAETAKLVYVVDENNDFSRFDPATKTFTKIGVLSCPADIGATPFSMSVDRTPTAWVLYSNGQLFKVSTEDASCQPTSYAIGQHGMEVFGMGFASNSAGSTDETLYIAGGLAGTPTGSSTFASLNFPSLTISTKGSVNGWPELTGTGEGKLWGFFPSESGTPKVAELNKSTGVDGTVFPLPTLAGQPKAWAFAFWGGDFWVFLMRNTDSSTVVYKVNGMTGAVSTAVPSTGRTIVGAGVSTCAPTQIL